MGYGSPQLHLKDIIIHSGSNCKITAPPTHVNIIKIPSHLLAETMYTLCQHSYITTATTIMFDCKHACGHVSSDPKSKITQ